MMSRPVAQKIRSLAAILLAAAIGHAFAADAPADEAETPLVTSPYTTVDAAHERVSGAVEGMAKNVDRFFADERSFQESNETALQIRFDTTARESGEFEFTSRVRAKWVFPHMQKKLRLVLESDPREAGTDSPEDDPLAAVDSASDYTLGLERLFETSDWEVRPSVGLRFDTPLDPYARLRAIRYFDLGPWLSRVSGTASWFNSDGVSLSANVDFDRPLDENLLFRSATGSLWEHDPDTVSLSQMFTVYQQLASSAKLAYDLGATFDNDPDWQSTDYFVRLRYRRLIYKSWAYLEVQPKVSWPEDNDYREDLSLLVRLEVNFGRGYLQ